MAEQYEIGEKFADSYQIGILLAKQCEIGEKNSDVNLKTQKNRALGSVISAEKGT
ncbi:hypothetical protein [Pseudolactococcus laudensis]|uniref:hypothetical protein n=1 Tax=Pseudolactococcus laudensis TaxID=1494461 RepID=UPI00027750BC|nr:hypothetical protein BN193_11070 [Lactococcus raffinolactis 4877]